MPLTPEQRRRLAAIAGQLALDARCLEAKLILDTADETWWSTICGNDGNGPDYDQGYNDGYRDGHEAGLDEGSRKERGRKPVNTYWRQLASDLLDEDLSAWEQEFCENFLDRRWVEPTDKMTEVFDRMARKFGITT